MKDFTDAITVHKSDAVDDFVGKLGPFAGTESTQATEGHSVCACAVQRGFYK